MSDENTIVKNKNTSAENRRSEAGMSLIAVMAVMTIFVIFLLAVAPTVQHDVQREKELESIRRGEEIAQAIRAYVEYYQGAKLPESIDDLVEGLPQGTKKRMILRPSAATDPLAADGKWRLISPSSKAFLNFGKRIQVYNNGILPSSNSSILDRYAVTLVNILNTDSEGETREADDSEIEIKTDKTPFIGVASQDRGAAIISYYGIENHSKWVFTPLFRGTSGYMTGKKDTNPTPPQPENESR